MKPFSTIDEISNSLEKGEMSSLEIVSGYFNRIDEHDREIGSFLSLCRDQALKDAAASDKRIAKGERLSFLDGIPIALKDNIITKGVETTCASKMLKGYTPPYDATVVEKLKRSGAVILGKLNMDEFAMGSSSERSAFKIIRNPWNIKHAPGGSSGGSAAAVAAGFCMASLGSDTGGSIRQPASFCGVVGLKPTYGRVSRYGLVAFASSLDQIGPLTRTTKDCAIMLNSIAGYDKRDSTSVDVPVEDYIKGLNGEIAGLKIGIPREYFIGGIEEETKSAVEAAIVKVTDLGAKLVDISLPHTDYAAPTYYILSSAEASSNLARFDGVKYGYRADGKEISEFYETTRTTGFGPEVVLRIILGTFVLSSGYYDAYYRKAQRVSVLIKQDFTEAFKKCDLILTPTSPTPAFRVGERIDDPLKMYLSDVFTIAVNLASLPAVSIPCGFSSDGLPIGMQLIGKPFDEALILKAAHAYEQMSSWHKKEPELR